MDSFDLQKLVHQLNLTRILVVAIIFSLVIGITGLAINQRVYTKALSEKEVQINSLISEVGELKNENQIIHNAFEKQNKIIMNNLDVISEMTETLDEDNLKIISLKSKIKSIYTDLDTAINEKQITYNELKNTNNELVKLEGQFENNQNILSILAVGVNEQLTDTILLIIINPETEKIIIFSIPRDLFVNGRKINSIYSSYGIKNLKNTISDITGIYPDKHIVVDFEGFIQAVDLIEGIDVYVYKDLYDAQFPDGNNGYKPYEITKGYHHFDGDEALKYARSRKSTSDFDRAKRQQALLEAIRLKLTTLNLIDDISKTQELFNIVIKYIETDITIFEGLYYLNKFQNYEMDIGNVLDTTNYLYATRSTTGAYILLPNDGNYSKIQDSVSELLKN